ncbi:MAG: hypothetical protein ACK56F_26375 [bacterium]
MHKNSSTYCLLTPLSSSISGSCKSSTQCRNSVRLRTMVEFSTTLPTRGSTGTTSTSPSSFLRRFLALIHSLAYQAVPYLASCVMDPSIITMPGNTIHLFNTSNSSVVSSCMLPSSTLSFIIHSPPSAS